METRFAKIGVNVIICQMLIYLKGDINIIADGICILAVGDLLKYYEMVLCLLSS